ncbi:major facilitator superfamily domain-containing protein [Fimicolochytrium jonesii]|uniref:major facilitator superfamily domain-containing protein n=1 Tax=Fimicolochytrium jonesii TaxID=1396493 RepID=UPI0022FF1C05|nr:major facilitator superfamily domain-containing protein [Fimicolochytrium jonesii]KAI8825125.1 major facilitator superfamily domain-containing protein [Fimicolochytrium jonesii]
MAIEPKSSQATLGQDVQVLDQERKHLGIRKVEAVVGLATKKQTYLLYAGIYLYTFVTNLTSSVGFGLQTYVTGTFMSHSSLPIFMICNLILSIAFIPLMSKLSDTWGRLELLVISTFAFCLGNVFMAVSPSFELWLASSLLQTVGNSGLLAFKEFFIADSSTNVNRALVQGLPDLSGYIVAGIAPAIVQSFVDRQNWQWAYGMFAILIILAVAPLAATFFYLQRTANRLGLYKRQVTGNRTLFQSAVHFASSFDLGGSILLTATLFLILVPLPLAETYTDRYAEPRIIAMLCIGCVILPIFVFYESRIAKSPIVPLHFLRNRTVLGGCGVAFWTWVSYYSYTEMFTAYLLVTQGLNYRDAGYVASTWGWAGVFSAIVVGFLIKRTKHYRLWALIGIAVAMVGTGLMIAWRGHESKLIFIIIAQAIVGLGGGFIMTAVQVGVQAAVKHTDLAKVTAIFLTTAAAGGAVGNAIVGSIWRSTLKQSLMDNLPPQAYQAIPFIMGSPDYVVGTYPDQAMPAELLPFVQASYVYVQRILSITALVAFGPAMIAVFLMKDIDLQAKDGMPW